MPALIARGTAPPEADLHYANFGERSIMIRLPNGLPDAKAAKAYLGDHSLKFVKDKSGPGGNLHISPYFEPDQLEDPMDLEDLVTQLLPLSGANAA